MQRASVPQVYCWRKPSNLRRWLFKRQPKRGIRFTVPQGCHRPHFNYDTHTLDIAALSCITSDGVIFVRVTLKRQGTSKVDPDEREHERGVVDWSFRSRDTGRHEMST